MQKFLSDEELVFSIIGHGLQPYPHAACDREGFSARPYGHVANFAPPPAGRSPGRTPGRCVIETQRVGVCRPGRVATRPYSRCAAAFSPNLGRAAMDFPAIGAGNLGWTERGIQQVFPGLNFSRQNMIKFIIKHS